MEINDSIRKAYNYVKDRPVVIAAISVALIIIGFAIVL